MDFHLDILLHLPHVTVESCSEVEGQIILTLRLLNETICCPHCTHEIGTINQTKYSLIRDLSICGKPVLLRVPHRQFYCRNCERFPTERLEFVDWRHRYTHRYENWIYDQVRKTSLEQVSREEHLAANTVHKIFHHIAETRVKKSLDTLNV